MPRKGKAAPTSAAPAPTQKPERTRPHRTPQTPLQQTDDKLYTVNKITDQRWSMGARQFLVRWTGYDADQDIWETMEHLVAARCVRK